VKDSIGRRIRTEAQASGKHIRLGKRDLRWLEALHHHGPLAASELHAFTSKDYPSDKNARARLTDLFNEPIAPYAKALLIRPHQQNQTIDARHKELIYDLSPAGIQALKNHDLWQQYQPKVGGPWWHKRETAKTTAELEIACLNRTDLNYIHAYKILERAQTDLRFETIYKEVSGPKAGQMVKRPLIPDGLLGLEYVAEDGVTSYRFFVLEVDRGTEPLTTSHHRRKSIERMLAQYDTWIGQGQYKRDLKLTAPIFLLLAGISHEQACTALGQGIALTVLIYEKDLSLSVRNFQGNHMELSSVEWR